MTIRGRLQFAAFVPLAIAVVIGVAVLWSYRQLETSREKGRTAQTIINDNNELISLAQSYVLHPEDRPRLQFLAVHGSIDSLISAFKVDRPDQRELLHGMSRSSDLTESLFRMLVSAHRQDAPITDPVLIREAQDRLAGQLLVRTRDVLADALQLDNLINDEIASTQRRVNALILVLIVAMSIPLTLALTAMMRTIARSLAALSMGTAAVAAGETGHRIGLRSHDELGELAREFDRMTEKLEQTTVSRDVLASEMQVRKEAEEALRAANARLSEADQRKNEFLAVLSHELRNPLAPITTSLHILDRARPGSEEARNAQMILGRQIRQLTRLVDDLLDVTRIARNKIRVQRERLELNDLVGRTIEDHRPLFADGAVALEFEPAPSPVYVDGDWSRLGQSLGNLLENARKFTGREGKVSVSVSTDMLEGMAVLRVADTGIGMTPQVLSHLYEPFMQADSTLDRSKGGLGLGLVLVKGIVELHGGQVSAHSAGLGKGSEFVVRLPLDLTEPAKIPPGDASKSPVRRRVLIIEDNRDAARSLQLLLGLSGHEVEVAYDGPGGIAKAREFHPDVLLCDIGLPEMDGYQVARSFRSDQDLRDTFLVALSGYALPEDLRRAADAGFDRHVAKPPNLKEIQDALSGLREPQRPPNRPRPPEARGLHSGR